ncbi:MAG: histidinol dehydrogenase [Akkermansia sp.]
MSHELTYRLTILVAFGIYALKVFQFHLMKIYRASDSQFEQMKQSMNRRAIPEHDIRETVAHIIADVATRGDDALIDYSRRFDKVELTVDTLQVSEEEMVEAERLVPDSVKEAIAATMANIAYFSSCSQRKDWTSHNAQGVEFGERFMPYDRVGIYIPGGKAPLVSTSLMTGGFAKAAGVKQIVAATPAGPDGKVNSALLYALKVAGATEIIKVGGAQAIAALALGTGSIAPVEKVFGPGNKFVVEAKRQVIGAVSIDLLPGPSEVMVLADDSADPEFLAADLLAQAEHGPDSVVVFVTDSEKLLSQVEHEVARQAALLSRGAIIRTVLDDHAYGFLTNDIDEGVELVNAFSPEHLVLVVKNEDVVLPCIRTAGAIYAGSFATVACGDFLAGPSHTLPTGGGGKSFSGLRADQFQRRTSIVRMTPESALKSAGYVAEFARVEGLDAHGHSMQVRAERANRLKE